MSKNSNKIMGPDNITNDDTPLMEVLLKEFNSQRLKIDEKVS